MAKEITKDELIKLSDRVDVYATEKCQHWKAGDKVRLHPVQAKAWIKAGKATANPVAAKAGKGSKPEGGENI